MVCGMKYSSLHPVAMKPALPTSISTRRRQRRRVGAPTPNCPDLSAPGAVCKAGLLPEYFLAQSEMAFPVSAICLG